MQQQIVRHISCFQPQFYMVLLLRSYYPLQCQKCFLHLQQPPPAHCNCSFLIWTKNVFTKIARGSLDYWLHFYTPFILICNLFTTHTAPTSSFTTLTCIPFLPTSPSQAASVTEPLVITTTWNFYFYCIIKVHKQSHRNHSSHARYREISFSDATEIKKKTQTKLYTAPLPPQICISYIYILNAKPEQNHHTKPLTITEKCLPLKIFSHTQQES